MLSRLHKSESGATAVLVAASMVLIMGMAALVVDYGLALSERRLDQNVADSAVMAGAIVTIQSGNPGAGLSEVRRIVDVNLGRTVTLAEWQACTDADRLAFQVDSTIDCISYATAADSLIYRVRIPKQDTETTFGKILGVDMLTTDAFAEATLSLMPGGKVLPFGLFAGTNSGEEACLKTSSPTPPAPCNTGPATGQFGGFSPFKAEPGAGFCQATSNVFEYAVAQGVDHPMEPFDPRYNGGAGVGPTNAIVNEWCVANTPPAAPTNTVDGSSGNQVSSIRVGLLEGGSQPVPYSSRLGEASPAIIDLTGPKYPIEINNEPIWDWFVPNNACDLAAQAAGTLDEKKTESLACITDWSLGDTAIFKTDFINSKRLAFVPQYDETSASSPGIYHIDAFVPVYLQALMLHSNSGGVPWQVHEPGTTGTISGQTLNAISAIVLECGMLIDTPCSHNADPGDPFSGDISTLLMSR